MTASNAFPRAAPLLTNLHTRSIVAPTLFALDLLVREEGWNKKLSSLLLNASMESIAQKIPAGRSTSPNLLFVIYVLQLHDGRMAKWV